jgi:hypothetical protein
LASEQKAEISFFKKGAKKEREALKYFSNALNRVTFAGSASDSSASASHRHRIARVPWELHELRLLLLTVVITAIPCSCSPS